MKSFLSKMFKRKCEISGTTRDNPCTIFVRIPPRFPGGIPIGIPDGISGGILERDPKSDPSGILPLQTFFIYVSFTAGSQVGLESQLGSRVGSQKQALARISKVGSQVKSRVVFAGYELLSQICNSVLCEKPGT